MTTSDNHDSRVCNRNDDDNNTNNNNHLSTGRRMRKRTVIATASATAFILISCCATTFNSRYNTADAFNIAPRPFSTTTNAYNNQASVFRLYAATPTRTSDTNIKRTTTTKDVSSLSSSSPPDEKESELSSYPSSSTPSPPSNHYDRQEFEMQVGRAMDTLRADYPDILIKDPDYSIYSSDLELIDPSGVHLHGVKNYEKAIRIVHSLVGIFYCPERSSITFRMCFDKARQNIRIHWNARIIPKAIFGGTKTTLHVDGISIYELDRVSGNITQHRLERLVMNDDYVTPEQGVFAALRRHAIQSQVAGIPSLSDGHHQIIMDNNVNNNNNNNDGNNFPNNILQFQNNYYNIFSSSSKRSILFRDEDDASSLSKSSFTTASSSRLLSLNSVSSSSSHPSDKDGGLTSSTSQSQQQQTSQPMKSNGFNQTSSSATTVPANSNSDLPSPVTQMDTTMIKELEKKNLLRKKFDLKPLNMEEFVELEGKVAELDIQQKKKVAAAMVELDRAKQEKANSGGGFLNKMFGNVLKDTCESNYDCESPEVCCDFGIKKMCCSSGMRVFNGLPSNQQGQMVKVPLINPNPYPPGDSRNRDPWG